MLVAVLAGTVSVPATSRAELVLTFDDLQGDSLPVPDGYGGITWSASGFTYYNDVESPYTPHSDPNRVYTFDSAAPFTFQTPQVFDGAWFSGQSFATVNFSLFNGANLVATSSTLAMSATPTFLSSGYSGLVTTVQVNSNNPDFYAMDDVTIGSPNAVPEPSTIAMVATALPVGLVWWARRRRRPA